MSSSIPDPVPQGATEAQLRHIINYWRVEAIHSHDVIGRLSKDNDKLRKQVSHIEFKGWWTVVNYHRESKWYKTNQKNPLDPTA